MPIRCPKCGREIPASDVNLAQALARCVTCNSVFACGTGGAYRKPQVPMPAGFSGEQEGPEFTLKRRWFSPLKAFGLLAFVVFWDGFLVVWYTVAFAAQGPIVMKVFPLIHVGVGVGLTYLMAATFINTTVICIGLQELSVKHGPLPWPGNAVLPRRDVQQLFCEERVTQGRNGSNSTYSVWAILRERRVKLVSGLDAPEQALFIEQRLEKQMGIQDRPVAGEMRPLS